MQSDAELRWTVVSNTETVQAVREGDSVQAIWTAGELTVSTASVGIQSLKVSAPALVLVEEKSKVMTVTASEPSGEVGKLRVTVSGNASFTGDNCTAVAGGTVFELSLPGKGDWQGKSLSASCSANSRSRLH